MGQWSSHILNVTVKEKEHKLHSLFSERRTRGNEQKLWQKSILDIIKKMYNCLVAIY